MSSLRGAWLAQPNDVDLAQHEDQLVKSDLRVDMRNCIEPYVGLPTAKLQRRCVAWQVSGEAWY